MSVKIDTVFRLGGKDLVNMLDYGVRAVRMDLLFIFLVGEYRQQPTAPKALVLYELFCGPQAPAPLSVTDCLPPFNRQMENAIRPLRHNAEQRSAASGLGAGAPLLLPPKYFFDTIDAGLRKKSAQLRSIRRGYRTDRTPLGNLPNGRMTAGQRQFVDRVWETLLRPRLLAAGFRRVTAIA